MKNYYTYRSIIFIFVSEYLFPVRGKSILSDGFTKGVLNGDLAEYGQMTYQVSLVVDDHNHCGGSIIHDQYVLSAAHCFIDKKGRFKNQEVTVIIGTNDIKDHEKFQIRIPVKMIYVPSEYEARPRLKKRSTADIAVLKLANAIGLENYEQLKVLSLPKDTSESFENKEATISGFGKRKKILTFDSLLGTRDVLYGSGKLSYAKALVISESECNKNLNHSTTKDHLCARVKQINLEKPRGMCQGDSGSPLVYNGNTVIGIASTTPIGCEELEISGVYTRVTSYIPFIEKVLNSEFSEEMRYSIIVNIKGSNGIEVPTVKEISFCSMRPTKAIIEGEFAELGAFTYQVSITVNGENYCGGGIIHDEYILTAAHCFIDDRGRFFDQIYIVVIGTNDLKNQLLPRLNIPVDSIYALREYEPETVVRRTTADIAVLKLVNRIGLEYRKEIMKLTLPEFISKTYRHKEAIISGFGRDKRIVFREESTGVLKYILTRSGKLRYAETYILSPDECNKPRKHSKINDKKHICAQVKQLNPDLPRGICKGDSGSPLVYKDNTVIGIASTRSDDCSEKLLSGLYTRVTAYKSFIENVLNDELSKDMRLAVYAREKNPDSTFQLRIQEITLCVKTEEKSSSSRNTNV